MNGTEPAVDEACRVLALSHSPLLAEALACLVGAFPGFSAGHGLIGEPLAPECGGRGAPHLVLVHASTPHGIEAVSAEVRSIWSAPIILLVDGAAPWCGRISRELGAVGWLSTEVTEEQLGRSLRLARVAGRLPELVVRSDPPNDEAQFLAPLTGREVEVLRLLVGGRSAEEIAHQLDISSNTVRTHVQNMLSNLGVHSQFEAVIAARRAGVQPAPAPDGVEARAKGPYRIEPARAG